MIRNIYFFILITHIVLAAAILPLILITLTRGLQEKFDRHRKIASMDISLVAVCGCYWCGGVPDVIALLLMLPIDSLV